MSGDSSDSLNDDWIATGAKASVGSRGFLALFANDTHLGYSGNKGSLLVSITASADSENPTIPIKALPL